MVQLRLTLIQTDLHWHNPTANRAMLEEKIAQIQLPTDLIILPEMFTTGFTMEASTYAEPMNLHTFKWLQQQAARTQAAVTGSYIVQENRNFYNRFIVMFPDGSYHTYDKKHLFRMANEHLTYTAGKDKLIFSWKGFNICPLICYDLRFPVWSRNRNNEYDLLIYVANFPQARRQAWNVLLQARAIENLAYVVGVNRIGTDGKGITYSGESAIIDYKGERLFYQADTEVIYTHTLCKQDLEEFRQRFPAFLDADAFEILL